MRVIAISYVRISLCAYDTLHVCVRDSVHDSEREREKEREMGKAGGQRRKTCSTHYRSL